MKTAIIIGATGLTGGLLLNKLLEDDFFSKVKLFSRTAVNISHPKIEEFIVDLFSLELNKKDFTADVVFCCIGTTQAKTPDLNIYKKIDYGIPLAAAKLCKENNIKTFIAVSALGANPKSTIFYNKTKGEMERDILKVDVERTYFLQPSLIGGSREEKRRGEYVAKILMKAINFLFIGPLKKYKSIHPNDIVNTMIWLSNNDYSEKRIVSDKIHEIANQA